MSDAAPLNGCWGCECGADLIDAMHEEPTDIPGKVYFYPCKSNVCLPPSRSFAQRTFDIDMYSCTCGHSIEEHGHEGAIERLNMERDTGACGPSVSPGGSGT